MVETQTSELRVLVRDNNSQAVSSVPVSTWLAAANAPVTTNQTTDKAKAGWNLLNRNKRRMPSTSCMKREPAATLEVVIVALGIDLTIQEDPYILKGFVPQSRLNRRKVGNTRSL